MRHLALVGDLGSSDFRGSAVGPKSSPDLGKSSRSDFCGRAVGPKSSPDLGKSSRSDFRGRAVGPKSSPDVGKSSLWRQIRQSRNKYVTLETNTSL